MPAAPTYSASVLTTTYERWFVSSAEKYNDLGSQQEIIQVYIIRRLDDGVVNYNGDDLNRMIVEGAIPAVGDLYENWDPSSARGMWQGLCRVRSIDFETIDLVGRLRVTIVWSCMAATDPKTIQAFGSTIPNPNPILNFLPASIEFQASLRSTKLFNTGWTTAPPTAATGSPYAPIDSTTATIGGTTVQDWKNGLDTTVSQVRVKLRIMRDATVAKMADQWTIVKDYIGKMHAGTADNFFNFAPGTIYCEGVSMLKLDHEYYEVIFEFLWDEFAHHDQVVTAFADGEPKFNGSSLNFDRVDWKRISRSGANFNNIFTNEPELKAIIERGYWVP
jgi:hypothetical protein